MNEGRCLPLQVIAHPHYLLATLLLTNAVALEMLPIFLDRLLNPVRARGWVPGSGLHPLHPTERPAAGLLGSGSASHGQRGWGVVAEGGCGGAHAEHAQVLSQCGWRGGAGQRCSHLLGICLSGVLSRCPLQVAAILISVRAASGCSALLGGCARGLHADRRGASMLPPAVPGACW